MRIACLVLVLVTAARASNPRITELLLKVRASVEGTDSNVAPAMDTEQRMLAGLHTYVWRPTNGSPAPHPLVIFSHGLHGAGSQSRFLCREMARKGYLVFAPDHEDAVRGRLFDGTPARPRNFGPPETWNDRCWSDRAADIRNLLAALHGDPYWAAQIDFGRVGLAGHSLGGYTALGLAGAWPSWKIDGVRAVLALSPAIAPFERKRTLAGICCPVMYLGGTQDYRITPLLKPALEQTPSPCYFVSFQGATHFSFSDIRHEGHPGILAYSIAFLDRFVKGDPAADPGKERGGIAEIRTK